MMAYFCFKEIDDNCHFIDANCRKIQSFAASNVGEAVIIVRAHIGRDKNSCLCCRTRGLRRIIHLVENKSIQRQYCTIFAGRPRGKVLPIVEIDIG